MKLFEISDELIEKLKYNCYFIKKALLFLKSKNLDETLKKNKFEFRYVINIIIDSDLVINFQQFSQAKNFLDKDTFNIRDLEDKINKINKDRLDFLNPYISYDFKYENGNIKYSIKDESKIGKKKVSKVYKRNYNMHLFNKSIIKNLNSNLAELETNIFRAINCNEQYCEEYYKDYKGYIFNIIRKILKSKAFIDYFNDKYKAIFPNISYHFNDDNIIDIILSKISFAPIFNEDIQGITDPIDLNIIINCIPGKFMEDIKICDRKILTIGKIILVILHEICSHFTRRYYSYLTHGLIAFDEDEDKNLNTGKEGSFFFEEFFLGFTRSYKSNLTITDALILFYWDKFEKYPIKTKINKEMLANIVQNNSEIFNFIGNNNNQITIEDYLFHLTPIKIKNFHQCACRSFDEDYISC